MKLVIQRVSQAKVEVDSKTIGSIGRGLLIFFGAKVNDPEANCGGLVKKIINLRIFEDNHGKFNHSLKEINGSALIVSQFTLYGDCKTGRRPSFTEAAPPEAAERLYNAFIEEFRQTGLTVETGQFAAKMDVSLNNEGPVTFILEK